MFSSLKVIAKRKILARQLRDTDAEARRAAVEELGEVGDATDVDVIAPALRDEDASVRQAAAKALREIGEHKAVAPLMDSITERRYPDGAWQTEILLALESLNDPRSVEACAQALTNASVKVRRTAASALGNLGEPSAIPALIAAMRDTDGEVVRQVSYALAKLGRAAVGPLIQVLHDESGQAQQAAADALGIIGDPQAIDPLIAALKSEDSFLQIAVAKSLSKFDDPRVVAPLVQALEESSTAAFFYGVREEAEVALVKMGSRAIESFLVALRDPQAGGRAIVARLLGQIPDPRSIEPLVDALNDPNLELRKAALHSLLKLDPSRAPTVAQFVLSDPDARMRLSAAEALVAAGWAPATPLEHALLAIGRGKFREAMWHGDEGVQLVLGCAQDEDAGIRREVFKALGGSGDPSFVDVLTAAAVTECEPQVQSAIYQALEDIGAAAVPESQPQV